MFNSNEIVIGVLGLRPTNLLIVWFQYPENKLASNIADNNIKVASVINKLEVLLVFGFCLGFFFIDIKFFITDNWI